jgi:uncharacterized protein YndB with AHSA1/START domain
MEALMMKKNAIEAKAQMLIRRPVGEVFEAFINPEITTKFWFTKGSGRLEPGQRIRWDWEMYNASAQVEVKEIEANKRILINWGSAGETPTTVEWLFTPHGNDATFVRIRNFGFQGDADKVVAQALDSTAGFTTVLDGAKAWLEHKLNLNLILDKFPQGLTEH